MSTPLVRALIQQVRKACPAGQPETEVVTVITRPMWRQFLTDLGDSPNEEPTAWNISKPIYRVYGSETYVVEGNEFRSYSMAREYLE